MFVNYDITTLGVPSCDNVRLSILCPSYNAAHEDDSSLNIYFVNELFVSLHLTLLTRICAALVPKINATEVAVSNVNGLKKILLKVI